MGSPYSTVLDAKRAATFACVYFRRYPGPVKHKGYIAAVTLAVDKHPLISSVWPNSSFLDNRISASIRSNAPAVNSAVAKIIATRLNASNGKSCAFRSIPKTTSATASSVHFNDALRSVA